MQTRTNVVVSCLAGVAILLIFAIRGGPETTPPPLGFERIPDDERDALAALVGRTAKDRINPAAHDSPVCYRARFSVVENLEPDLTVGVLQAGRAYEAVVRLSNAPPHTRRQPVKPVVAIKLLGVDGHFLDEADPSARQQDFILGPEPTFMYADAAAYSDAIVGDAERRTSARVEGDAVPARTFTRFWSMTPYRFDHHHAVKYAMRACDDTNAGSGRPIPECFEFMLQFQTDPAAMPIENATVEWDEVLSPFEPVALLTLVHPVEPSAAAQCGLLAFSAWQSLTVHRPLGGINRAQRVIDEFEAVSPDTARDAALP